MIDKTCAAEGERDFRSRPQGVVHVRPQWVVALEVGAVPWNIRAEEGEEGYSKQKQ
jgi:hypothetical protein